MKGVLLSLSVNIIFTAPMAGSNMKSPVCLVRFMNNFDMIAGSTGVELYLLNKLLNYK
jgi:hypothetical protein